MTQPIPHNVLLKVRKLARLPEEVRQSRWAVSITRLTTLKSLCQEPEVAHRFATYLARKTLERVRHGGGRSSHPDTKEQRAHKEMMADALAQMEAWIQKPSDDRQRQLWDLLGRMRAEQNEYKNIPWGAVRLIDDWELLLFEYALNCLLNPAHETGYWAYQSARHFAERYNSSEGTGLIAASIPSVQDIADFWIQEFDLDPKELTAPAREKKMKKEKSAKADKKPAEPKKDRFTARQGQFLAFIHLYRKMHRQGPAETDLVKFFRVTPPSVHGMIVKLEELGLISRKPGVARSARVTIPEGEIPPLEDVSGPPW